MFGSGGCGPGPGGPRGRFKFAGPLRHLPMFGGARGAWLEGIDLTDEQIEKIAELRQKSFSKMAHGRVDKMELTQALFRELGSQNIDKSKIAELKGKIKEHKATMTELMVDNMLAFAEILTAEQRKKIRIKRIRQFLGTEDHEHEHDHEHHEHEHRHRHHD